MKLSFYARGAALVSIPGVPRVIGQPTRRVGRSFVPATPTTPASYPATQEPFVCDAESDTGKRMVRMCADLWCADKETAAFCRVPYVPVVFQDGEWVEAREPEKTKPAPSRKPELTS